MAESEKVQSEYAIYDFTDLEVAEYLKQASIRSSDSEHCTATGSSCSSSMGSHDTVERSRSASVMTNIPRGNLAASVEESSPSSAEPLTLNELAFRGELTAYHLAISDEPIDSRLSGPDTEDGQKGHGFTPLITASSCGWLHVVELLLNNGATVGATDCRGATALMHAACTGHLHILEALLTANADINAQCTNGSTALHYAVYSNNIPCVSVLLSAGADLTLTDNNGHTAATLASALKHTRVQDVISRHLLSLFMDE